MYTDDRFWEGVSNLDEAAAVPVAPCNAETRRSRSYATRQINYSLPPSECFSFSPLYCSRTRHFSPVVVYLTRKTREMLCWGHFNPSMQCALSFARSTCSRRVPRFLPFFPSVFVSYPFFHAWCLIKKDVRSCYIRDGLDYVQNSQPVASYLMSLSLFLSFLSPYVSPELRQNQSVSL